MKKLKDYLHFYLGCELLIIKTGDIVEFDELQSTNTWPIWTRNKKYNNEKGSVASGFKFKEIKLILRPLSSMTGKEFEKTFYDKQLAGFNEAYSFENQFKNKPKNGDVAMYPENFTYLLSRQFDLFGLIELGLAIDKTTVTS